MMNTAISTKKAYRLIEGAVVKTRSATWQEAADAIAQDRNCEGLVIFSCPNYAVVRTGPGTEITIWAA